MTAAADHRLASLTVRELRLLEFVALGRTNSSIARTLDISPRTVAKHLEHICRKLQVTSRAAAVYYGNTSGPIGKNGSQHDLQCKGNVKFRMAI
jgi:DNA-binding CsgD family transcriptional regulator